MKFTPPIDQPVFRAGLLPAKAAPKAFPLVHLADPTLDLPGWIELVEARTTLPRGMGGLTAFEDERGYIHGLFSWLVHPPETVGSSLRISDMVLAHWPGRALQDAVLGEIKSLAGSVRASSVLVETPVNGKGLRGDLLVAGGFTPVGDSSFIAQCGSV